MLSFVATYLTTRNGPYTLINAQWKILRKLSQKSVVPQGLILGLLFFLTYMNDLSNNSSSNPKLFADGTLLFLVVHDINQWN